MIIVIGTPLYEFSRGSQDTCWRFSYIYIQGNSKKIIKKESANIHRFVKWLAEFRAGISTIRKLISAFIASRTASLHRSLNPRARRTSGGFLANTIICTYDPYCRCYSPHPLHAVITSYARYVSISQRRDDARAGRRCNAFPRCASIKLTLCHP